MYGRVPLRAGNPGKNLKVGVSETDFKQVPFVFRQTTCTYSESWGPVENFCDPPLHHPNRKSQKIPGGGIKMAEKIFVSKFFSLILPKKHCLTTQNEFWPFLGVLSGFIGVPRTLNFGGLSLYFDNSL